MTRLHQHPSLDLPIKLIRRWQSDFASSFGKWRIHQRLGLEELLEQMRRRGSALTSSFTLRIWLCGGTLCPENPDDLLRLAEVLDMDFVRQNYRHIHRAAIRLRGLHRGLSKRLNRWLEQQATGLTGGSDGAVIDADLGLTFGDFRNSLLVLRVATVQPITGPFLRTSMGTLERHHK